MVIHVKDETTDWLVREFARRRGIGITEAIRTAIEEATVHERRSMEEVLQGIEPILAQVRARKAGGFEEAQNYIDDMWGGQK